MNECREEVWRFLDGGGVGCVCARVEEVCASRAGLHLPCAEERERLERFRRDEDRDAFRAGRVLLRSWILRNGDPEEVRVIRGDHGKPECPDPQAYAFNLSHTAGWVALALARDRQVGVDVESLNRKVNVEKAAARYYSPQERRKVEEEGREGFLRIWTRKEALVKATGIGVARGAAKTDTLNGDPGEDRQQAVFQPDERHTGCVAYTGAAALTAFWRWFPREERLQRL